MATKSFNFQLFLRLLRVRRSSVQGFTLIELLVTLIVGSIIVAGMLYLVIELLQINRREEVLTRTQQDMQRALDYISRDVREAVYVYPKPDAVVDPDKNPDLTDTLLYQLRGSLPTGAEPILAFWRFDPVNVGEITTAACNSKSAECNTLRVRQGTYSLVLYLQQQNAASDIWGGKSRIVRYELSKYSNLGTLQQRKGYSDPGGNCNSFRHWSRPPGRDPGNPCDPGNNIEPFERSVVVLTDYVNWLDVPPTEQTLCPTGYTQTPATPKSFHVCVSSGTANAGAIGANQVVRVYLQGSVYEPNNQTSPLGFLAQASSLPTLESEILVRGVLDKNPQ